LNFDDLLKFSQALPALFIYYVPAQERVVKKESFIDKNARVLIHIQLTDT